MHREIEKFVSECKEKMEKIGWTYLDLAKVCGMHEGSFTRIFGPRKMKPSDSTILKIAQALGVAVPFPPGTTINVSMKTRGIGQFKVEDKEKTTLSDMEEKMKKAMICFRQGVELLAEIDNAAEKAINEIAERMRATSMLKKSLDVFRKH